MRRLALLPTLALAAVTAPAMTPGTAIADTCGAGDCGLPSCWEPMVHARPDMPRALTVSCRNVQSATVLTPPEHGTVSGVRTDLYGIHFTLHEAADAPRGDHMVLEAVGPEGKIEIPVQISVVPLSENSPPVCHGDRISRRSDGTGPVDLFMHPSCHDPDFDEFVMYGGGPGVHPESPKHVPSGWGEANWRYRTATFSGTEVATVWAVDELDARSDDARLEVSVGPNVDQLPTCRPNPWMSSADGVAPVYSRPGATRRFAIICEDPDADLFTPLLSSPPSHGVIAPLAVGPNGFGFWGVERWIDATYVPETDSLERDEFSITASGVRGAGPNNRIAIVPRTTAQNHGGGCGWSPASVVMNVPGAVKVRCNDDDGDPLSVEVLSGPLHGTATQPAVLPGPYGDSEIVIPYAPAAGYEGYDCVKIKITDGHGYSVELTVDINVAAAPPPPPAAPLPPDLTTVPIRPSVPPAAVPPPAPTPQVNIRRLAARALGTSRLQHARMGGSADVFLPRRFSKRRLMRKRRLPALFVACAGRCRVGSRSALELGGRRARAGRRSTVTAATPDAARVVWLTIDSRESARLRGRKARARFELTVRPVGGKTRRLSRAIRIGG